jgi:hypothetical protein
MPDFRVNGRNEMALTKKRMESLTKTCVGVTVEVPVNTELANVKSRHSSNELDL